MHHLTRPADLGWARALATLAARSRGSSRTSPAPIVHSRSRGVAVVSWPARRLVVKPGDAADDASRRRRRNPVCRIVADAGRRFAAAGPRQMAAGRAGDSRDHTPSSAGDCGRALVRTRVRARRSAPTPRSPSRARRILTRCAVGGCSRARAAASERLGAVPPARPQTQHLRPPPAPTPRRRADR